MAEPEVVIAEDQAADEEMGEAEGGEEIDAPEDGEPTGLEDIEPTIPERTTFLEYVISYVCRCRALSKTNPLYSGTSALQLSSSK